MKILTTPDPFLAVTAEPVKKWTIKLQKQLEQMIDLLKNSHDPQGMGLAATQVGINKRFFILLNRGRTQIFINPRITKSSVKMLSDKYKNLRKRPLEGCLSIPKLWGFVDRPYQITLSYQTLDGQSFKLLSKSQTFTDIPSSLIQHERDHLDGILFTDHILRQSASLYRETKKGLMPISL